MRKIVLFLSACVCVLSCTHTSTWGDRIIVCGDRDLYIVNTVTSGDSLDVIWHWNAKDHLAELPDGYERKLRSLDDCKMVDKGSKILVTSSSDATLLIDAVTGKVLFYAETPMAHSADWLPGGRIAVANSVNPNGNSIELYDSALNDVCLWRDTLFFGHGAVWNDKRQMLYALGYNKVKCYAPVDWETDHPSMQLKGEYSIPGGRGHELSPIGDDRLLVSGGRSVNVLDLNTGELTPFEPLANVLSVKSANFNPETGRLIYTRGETSWWSNHVHMVNPDKLLTFDEKFKLYKVRVVE